MKVELLACTPNPMKTMFSAWTHTMPCELPDPQSVYDKLWDRWVVEPTSALEFVHLSFLLLGVSRAFLAQITRHRMLGFWVQSMRTTDMSNFEFEVPAELNGAQCEVYKIAMRTNQEFYSRMLEAKVPLEIARDVIPLGSPTNIAVAGNLRAWAGLIRPRTCLMAQQGVWAPVLAEIRRLMVQVEPRFGDLFNTPCHYSGECPYRHEQQDRIVKGGQDFRTQPSLGVCPVYLTKFGPDSPSRAAEA
jgi:flavin-dependent thymidylate synthase